MTMNEVNGSGAVARRRAPRVMKRTLLVASAVALASTGLAVGGGSVASAAKPVITAGPGSSVTCSISAKVKVKPKLKDNWIAADHAGDPDPSVAALPDTQFADPGPVAVKAKAKSVSCSGTVTDGVNTAVVTQAKIDLVNNPSFPGSSDPATCAGLIAPETPSTARYDAYVKWKASGAKVNPTTISAQAIVNSGLGFAVTGGTVSGSFAGGTGTTQANVDGATLGYFLSSTALNPGLVTSATPITGKALPCQPSLKLKLKKGVPTAKLKKPKGINKIIMDPATSTFTISR